MIFHINATTLRTYKLKVRARTKEEAINKVYEMDIATIEEEGDLKDASVDYIEETD